MLLFCFFAYCYSFFFFFFFQAEDGIRDADVTGVQTCALPISLGPVIAVTQLGGRGVWLAALQASAIGYLIGSIVAGRTRVSRAVMVGNLALLTYAAPLLLFAFAAPAWTVVGAYGIAIGCLGFMNPVWETVVQQQIPEHVLARVTA